MSFFGKNIKKIRSVKGLSQQSFADLFDLKRGTLGAYEEGRSEPKIETLIKIANYFSILIDDLLKNELTVNQLLKFRDNVVTNVNEVQEEKFREIPCINESNSDEYILNGYKNFVLKHNSFLKLPVNSEKELIAYTINSLAMSVNEDGFLLNDIVIGEKVNKDALHELNESILVIALLENKLLFRNLIQDDDKIILKSNHKGIENQIFDKKEVKELWEVKYAFFKHIPEFSNKKEDRFFTLENKVNAIFEKISAI